MPAGPTLNYYCSSTFGSLHNLLALACSRLLSLTRLVCKRECILLQSYRLYWLSGCMDSQWHSRVSAGKLLSGQVKGQLNPPHWENTETSLYTEVTLLSVTEFIFCKESYVFKHLGNFSYILTHQRKMDDWLNVSSGLSSSMLLSLHHSHLAAP